MDHYPEVALADGRVCTVDGCLRAEVSRGLCALHDLRLRRRGTTKNPPTVLERFWSKVDQSGDCWLWQGYKSGGGYGQLWYKDEGGRKRTRMAHRFVYEVLVGPIPVGLTLDHLCFVRNCVRPDHLEPVTREENTRRARARERAHRAATDVSSSSNEG